MEQPKWSKHYRSYWERQAGSGNAPLWVRVFALAYGRHHANGHTPFEAGELARIFGHPPTESKPFRTRNRGELYRAIERAAELGYLQPSSTERCLIVPHGQIQYGIGEAFELCDVCTKRADRSAA